MTPRQIYLARQALGLPNKQNQTYRNRFVAGPGHVDYEEWNAMVAEGFAQVARNVDWMSGDDCFHLTRAGAEPALKRGERLDREFWGSK